MFKGVNRKVVEINQTGNDYIERAILFLNPDKAEKPQDELIYWAEEYLKQMDNKNKKRGSFIKRGQKTGWISFMLIFVLGGLFGCLIYYLVM